MAALCGPSLDGFLGGYEATALANSLLSEPLYAHLVYFLVHHTHRRVDRGVFLFANHTQ